MHRNFEAKNNTMSFFQTIENKVTKKGKMIMSGFISPYGENQSQKVIAAFSALAEAHDEIEVTLMNFYGGSVFEGLPIYNTFRNSSKKVTVMIEGLVASMGTILALGGHEVYMAKKSRQMFHKVSGGAVGDSDKLRESADLMDSLENDLVDAIAERTGMKPEKVKELWMQRGKDTYITADQALKYKLIDGIREGSIKKDAPKSLLESGDPMAIANYYEQQIQNSLTNNEDQMKNLGLFIAALQLGSDATEETVLAAVQKMAQELAAQKSENATLKTKVTEQENTAKEAHKAKCAALVDGAVAANKITAAQKDHFNKLAEADYDSTKAILDVMKPHKTISSQLRDEGEGQEDPRAKWTIREWEKNDPKGLLKMKQSEPEKYQVLYDAFYKKS